MSGSAAITGSIVRRGDATYESVITDLVWNGLKPARRPDVVVLAATRQDVAAAVNMARSHGLRIAVRSGGHNWTGVSLREGGMLLDLSALQGYHIDSHSRTATVQPAVTSAGFAAELARFGLSFPTGHCGSVGLGGFLLSGGLGWNSRALGPACASVQEIEAVTADGQTIWCNAEEHPDLFWAARGAGPGFCAVATQFRLGLHPLPSAITTTTYAFPLADVAPVARWATATARRLHPTVELTLLLGTAAPEISAQSPRPRVVIVSATVFADNPDQAVRRLAPLHGSPFTQRALFRRVGEPASFNSLYAAGDNTWKTGLRYAADTLWSHTDLEALLVKLGEALADAPSEKSLVLAPISPAPYIPAQDATMAFSVLGRSYVVPYAVWTNASDDRENIQWLRSAMRTVEPYGTGHYIAETDLTADPARAERSFAPNSWRRLRSVRARYDPQGVFHSCLSL